MKTQNYKPPNNTVGTRLSELRNQKWNRSKSEQLAKLEGIELNDEQWEIISFLRSHYLWNGSSKGSRFTARALNNYFSHKGGSKYLHCLFKGGPVTQGSRLANLFIPENSTDS